MNRRYWKKRRENPLPKLQEDERIYLNVPYSRRYFAKECRCGFDPEIKLWFTGCYNAWLSELVEVYGLHDRTSDKARKLLDKALHDDREQLFEILSNTRLANDI